MRIGIRLAAGVAAILCLLLPGADAGAAGHGRGGTARKIVLAIPEFLVEGEAPAALAKEIPAVLRADLSLLPLFEPAASDSLPGPSAPAHFAAGETPPDLSAWKDSRAEAVLFGRVEVRGEQATIEIRIFDPSRNALVFGRKYAAPRDRVRGAIHRVANDIPFAFTGVRGVFDTEIAFTARPLVEGEAGRGKEIFLVGLDGENLRQATANGSFNLFPRWAPDGRRLAFTSFRTGVPRIYLLDVERGTEEEVAASGTSLSPGGFSPSGDILYYSRSESGTTDVLALPIGAESPARVATGAISTSPTVSPDGTLMAFVSDRHGSPGIFVKELGKPSSERQITPPGKFSTSPCWSPAGDVIAFTAQEKGRFSLMLVRPDGTELKTLLTGGGDYIDPTFSPDGRFVAYTYQEKGKSELRIVSVDGRFSRRVFSGLPGIGSPSWSPRR